MQPPRTVWKRTKVPALLFFLLVSCSCKGAASDVPGAAPSPQASAEPAPLANVPATATNAGTDAGPPPEPFRNDRSLAADVPHETAREPGLRESAREARELGGYVLQALVRAGEGAPAPKWPESNPTAIEAAKRRTEARMAIDASQTRARFVLSGGLRPAPRDRASRARRSLWPPGDVAWREHLSRG
jgi:hypothetical protein